MKKVILTVDDSRTIRELFLAFLEERLLECRHGIHAQ